MYLTCTIIVLLEKQMIWHLTQLKKLINVLFTSSIESLYVMIGLERSDVDLWRTAGLVLLKLVEIN
jgi:hypothetical protein